MHALVCANRAWRRAIGTARAIIAEAVVFAGKIAGSLSQVSKS
jgi:hypothetical protein